MSHFCFQFDRFSERVIQAIFSTPGIKAPTEKLNDDGIIDALKKVLLILSLILQAFRLFYLTTDIADSILILKNYYND